MRYLKPGIKNWLRQQAHKSKLAVICHEGKAINRDYQDSQSRMDSIAELLMDQKLMDGAG